MSALDSTPSRSRPMSGDEGAGCALCKAEKRRYRRPASRILWVLGRPFMRVCLPHEKEARKMWEAAL